MPYATPQDLIDRFGEAEVRQLTDLGDLGVVDEARAAAALQESDAEIDTYLRGRYALPLTPVPALLTRLACELTREALYVDAPGETVKGRAEAARRLLREIAAGRAHLEFAAGGEGAQEGREVQLSAATRPKIFGGGL